MSKNGELPEVDPSWRDKGSLGSQYGYEQRSAVFQIRERLFAEVERHVGKTQMYLDQVVRAIQSGVGEKYTLELKAAAQTSDGSKRLRLIVSSEVYEAITNYEKS